jgi:transcriptional regulator with XRE-family HTH domain
VQPTFAFRLNRLLATVYPPGRGPFTAAEVVAALRRQGVSISAPYLSQLRSGNRTAPSEATRAALADFFRVSPEYFTDDAYYRKLNEELAVWAALRDEGTRAIAMRSIGLSREARQEIVKRAEELRRKEHLDD